MSKLLVEVFSRQKKPDRAQLERVVLEIKKLQQQNNDARIQGYYDRLQRASSWFAKAKGTVTDPEARFIFLWIALNSLCGVRSEVIDTEWWESEKRSRSSISERQDDERHAGELEWFLWRVCGLDVGERILKKVIEDHLGEVTKLLGVRYLMSSYWKWKGQTEEEIDEWKDSGRRKVKDAISSLSDRVKMYRALREIIAWRLRTLRNQLLHGCATDTHSKRRATGESELEAGSRLLEELIWVFLVLMASESGRARYWPPCPYPRAGSAQHQSFDDSWLPKLGGRNAPFQ